MQKEINVCKYKLRFTEKEFKIDKSFVGCIEFPDFSELILGSKIKNLKILSDNFKSVGRNTFLDERVVFSDNKNKCLNIYTKDGSLVETVNPNRSLIAPWRCVHQRKIIYSLEI